MALTSGVFAVHLILQKIVPQPWHLISRQQLATPSHPYSKRIFKLFRIFLQFVSFGLFLPFLIYRLSWLFFNWKTYTIYHVDQAVVYGMVFCVFLIFLPTCHVHNRFNTEIIHIINQLHQFRLRCSYCPLQLIIGSNYFVKVVESFYYTVLLAFNVFGLLSVILLIIMILDTLCFCTSKMFFPACVSNLRFRIYYRQFRSTEILFKIVNISFGPFLTVLIFVGITLASCTGSMTVQWYRRINTLVYMLMPVVTIMGFTYSLLLTYLANIPYENSKRFLNFWRIHLRKKGERRMIAACKTIEIRVRPYGFLRAQLGILICNDIVQNMITISLLDGLWAWI